MVPFNPKKGNNMDIDRFKQTAQLANSQAEREKQFTINFYKNTTNYFIQLLPTFADKISFSDLDNLLNDKISVIPNADTYCFQQTVSSPKVSGNTLYYTGKKYGHKDDLWKLPEEKYELNNVKKIFEANVKYVEDYYRGFYLEYSVFSKYLNIYLIPKVVEKLNQYGLTILDTHLSGFHHYEDNSGTDILSVTVKNPLK